MSNTTILSDFQQLTKDDLIDEYEKLADAHRQLKLSEDAHLQQIHELRRSLQTATNAETYLAAELDSISSVHIGEIEQMRLKHGTELDAVRKKHAEAMETVSGLEGELDAMRKSLAPLRQALQEQQQTRSEPTVDIAKSAQMQERLHKTEEQNARLLEVVETVREQLSQALKQIVQNEKRIEDLCDQLECVQSTLDSKREELEEKTQLFETAQERICQLSGELATLQSQPETDTKKRGNSLFAEVDDQRQEMRVMFAAQKKHYMQMKFEFDQSQQEIRSLKRENAAMHKELQICSAMFMNADKTYKEKLNERIGQLLSDNQKLDSKLRCTESMLVSMGNEHGVTWLDSMLKFCKNETREMQETLKTCRLQKSTAEETLHNVTQDLARWRFEALKSRCIIINRETLLEEHKIAFDTEPGKIAKMAQRMDTPQVQPNIVDASSCILRPSNPNPSTKRLSLLEIKEEHHIKQEPVSQAPTFQVDDIETVPHNISNVNVSLPITDDIKLLTPKKECFPVAEFAKTEIRLDSPRSPLQPLQECPMDQTTTTTRQSDYFPTPLDRTTPAILEQTCDISAILSETRSSINSFVPQYRNISIDQQSMASLENNMARLKPSSTPRYKNVKRVLNLPDETSKPIDTYRTQSKPESQAKVKFSESTIEAVERKELGLPSRKTNVSPVAVKLEFKIEQNENSRPMHSGINRRIVVKSKKPTVFPD